MRRAIADLHPIPRGSLVASGPPTLDPEAGASGLRRCLTWVLALGVAACHAADSSPGSADAGEGAGSPDAPPSEDRTQYLAFQVLTFSPAYLEPYDPDAPGDAPDFEPTEVDAFLRSQVEAIGVRGDGVRRKLAFVLGPLTLDHTDEQLRDTIRQGFALAIEHGVAVGFHIDDSTFWQRRSDLWRDPANVEWSDWEGTPNTGRMLSWGGEFETPPQMCFNSSAVTAEIRRIARDVIGAEVAAQVASLDDPALFAGVIAGWETQIGQDFDTRAYLGYCALANRGFSAAEPPTDLDREREIAVQGFIELWSSGLVDGGVEADKIYSHIAPIPESVYEMFVGAPFSYSELNHFAVPWTAFGDTHNPGFSLYAVELDASFYELLREQGSPPWAMSEGGPGGPTPDDPDPGTGEWEPFLAARFNHGATLVNTFILPTAEDDYAAIRKFLDGGVLEER